MTKYLNRSTYLAIAVILGLFAGYANIPQINDTAAVVSEVFINLLKLVSLPIIFLSIISTASSMESMAEIKFVGRKVLKYTLSTTIIAAAVALGIYLLVNPVTGIITSEETIEINAGMGSYFSYLVNVIPSNFMQPFLENNVIGVLFIAVLLSLAIITLPEEKRKELHSFFSCLYSAIMKVTTWVINLMPIAICAFITLFIKDLRGGMNMQSIALYLCCVVAANLVQGLIILPLFLRYKGISPAKLGRSMSPALSIAFFSKSSSGALPMAMKCAEERAGVSPKVASFSLPLCTTINMNGCAAFILTTVLFVSMSHGVTFTAAELVMWIFLSTIAAVGNAGVPMGCYFLASAFLVSMNVPLNILGIILPFYSLIDMLESAVNVWSDSCVTAVVDKELKEESELDSVEDLQFVEEGSA